MKLQGILGLAACTVLTLVSPAWSAIEYNQDVTNNVIFGSGNANGSWTTDRENGIELGLRAKLRHNAAGNPENTFNSNNDGTYSFDSGVAFGQSPMTAVWSFEWSINSDYATTPAGTNLDSYSYRLSIDTDSSAATMSYGFDPINGINPPGGPGVVLWDHSIGNNMTGSGDGDEFGTVSDYADAIANNNLAQNSWKPHWFIPMFDPTVDGIYDFQLEALNANGGVVASTGIQVLVGNLSVVPEPVSFAVWSVLGIAGVFKFSRIRNKSIVSN